MPKICNDELYGRRHMFDCSLFATFEENMRQISRVRQVVLPDRISQKSTRSLIIIRMMIILITIMIIIELDVVILLCKYMYIYIYIYVSTRSFIASSGPAEACTALSWQLCLSHVQVLFSARVFYVACCLLLFVLVCLYFIVCMFCFMATQYTYIYIYRETERDHFFERRCPGSSSPPGAPAPATCNDTTNDNDNCI